MEIFNFNEERFAYRILEKMRIHLGSYHLEIMSDIEKVVSKAENSLQDSTIDDLAEQVVLLFFPQTSYVDGSEINML